ncbi:MAG: RHS repeat-associated core domain-containing protein [Myxococcales bacterium]
MLEAGAPSVARFVRERVASLGKSPGPALAKLREASKLARQLGKLSRAVQSDDDFAGRARSLLEDLPKLERRALHPPGGRQLLHAVPPKQRHATLEEEHRLHPRYASAANVLSDAAVEAMQLDEGALSPPTPADLAPTPEAPITPAITALAQQLGNDPLQIYEYVLNGIQPEPYAGSKKGALGALAEGVANDSDISSLLVSLLRAAGIPSRYEMGMVLLTPKQAEDWADTTDPTAAVTAMETIGMAATALTGADGSVTGVQLDQHVWVRAYVPYTNYRGSNAPGSRSIWIRLDPTVKPIARSAPPVYPGRQVSFDFLGYLSGTTPGSTTSSPLDVFDGQVRAAALDGGLACDDLNQLQLQRSVLPEALRLLPYDLGTPIAQSEAVSPTLPSGDYAFTIDVDGEASQVVSLPQTYGQTLAVVYVGDTPADVQAIQQAGSIGNVNPQEVTVDPALLVGGQELWRGSGVSPGTQQTLTVTVNEPGVPQVVVQHDISAGSLYALGLAVGHPTDGQLASAKAAVAAAIASGAPPDELDEAWAQALALTYVQHIDRDEKPIFGLYGQTGVKDVTEILAGRPLVASTFFGIPVGVAWGKWAVDVKREANTPIPQDNDNAYLTPVNELAGFQGSHWENRLFEEVFNAPGLSTTDGCQLGVAAGVPLVTLTALSQTSELSGYDSDALGQIEGALAQGATATLPQRVFSSGSFSGVEAILLLNPDGTGLFLESSLGEERQGGESSGPQAAKGVGENGTACSCSTENPGSTLDLGNGRYYFTRSDLSLPAVGLPVAFTRSYDSGAAASGTLGNHWLHSYERRLTANADGSVSYTTAEQQRIQAPVFAVGNPRYYQPPYLSPPGWNLTLAKNTDGSYTLGYKDGRSSSFDASGQWVSDQDLNGNRVTGVRNGDGTLGSVIDASGRTALTFTYASGELTGVADAAGRSVSFAQQGGQLTSATDVLGDVEGYAYDAQGRLVSRTDKNGHVWAIAYDGSGRWDQEVDPEGHVESASYDNQGLTTAFTDRNGNTSVTSYNANGNPVAATDALGNTKTMSWDANLDKLTETDARGNTTYYGYDSLGNETSKADPTGAQTQMSYDANSRLTYQLLPDGETTTNVYDAKENLQTSTDKLNNTTSYGYDGQGQLQSVLQPGNTTATTFAHNPDGTIQSMIDATGAATAFGYDGAGHLTSLTDPAGHTRTMQVDARGQVTSMTDAAGNQTSFGYDAQGNRTSLTDPSGAKTAFGYDGNNRLTTTADAQGHVATTAYDGNGNVTSRTDANGHTSAYLYDEANRLIQTTDATGAITASGFCADIGSTPCQQVDPNGNVTQRSYDADGRPSTVTDGAGNIVTTAYTAGGKLSRVTDPMGNYTTYSYDPDGRLASGDEFGVGASYSYDARGNRSSVYDGAGTTRFTYDASNRLTTETNPLNQVTTYSYNPDGTRATKLDAKGNLTTYSYDPNKRLTSVTFQDGSQYVFAFDTRGHRTLEQSPDETRSFTYDALGRMATATDAQLAKTLTFAYDAAGNRTSMGYDGLTTTYVYDHANRLTALTDPDGESTTVTHDPGGRRTSLVQGNGVLTSYTYDAANRLTSLFPSGGEGQGEGALPSFAYTYDPNGNPLTKTFAAGTQEQYLYDQADRLLDFTNTSGLRAAYSYLSGGGFQSIETTTSIGGFTSVQGFTDNAFNQVTLWQPGVNYNSYTYDANGNRTTFSAQNRATYPYPPPAVTTYTWTLDDRLATATLPNGQLDTFKYDANGLRVAKSDSTGSVRYLIDPLTQAILATYDAGTGLRLMQFNQNPQKLDEVFSYKTAQGAKYYPHTDMLGSVYALSDSTGTSQATWTYDVYGTRTQTSGTLSYAFGFTGREHDGDTGLIYSRARYYDPSVGSWLSKDRIGYLAGPNLYAYVLDRPTLMTDLTGMICLPSDTANYLLAAFVLIVVAAAFATGIGEASAAAITAADLGLPSEGLISLAGSVVNSGATRILTVDFIQYVEGSLSYSQIVNALPTILAEAGAAGVATLQIVSSLANSNLASFLAQQVEELGGEFASVGGADVITFLLGD